MRFLATTFVLLITLGCSNDLAPVTQSTPAATAAIPDVATESSTATAGQAEIPSSIDPIVIDVRTQEEWDSGHVEQAVLIPHEDIASRIAEVASDKDAKIVLYCKSGGRAGRAKEALEGMGFTNVENAGGYEDIKDRFAEQSQ